MAKNKYAIECPICKFVVNGYTHVQTEDNLKSHVYKKHPGLWSAMKESEDKSGVSK